MQPFPKWISWIFVCFLAYIIYVGNQSDRPPASAPEEIISTASTAPKEYDSLRQLTSGDRWFRAIDPSYVGEAEITEITKGKGDAVTCGSEVEVLLRGTTQEGANFDPSHDESKPLKFSVGDAPIEALNEGMIGMKQGGVRVLNAPAKQVYKNPEERTLNEIKFNLTLQKFSGYDSEQLPATSVTLVMGSNAAEPARCGAKIHTNISVFDAAGKLITKTSKPVSFTLGKRELAQGIDSLARGMNMGEERLLYIPPHYLKQSTKANASLQGLRQALRSKQMVAVYITRVNAE